MTPGARVAAAIDVIDRWRAGTSGLDRVLAAWGRAARYAGSGDRRAVADLTYDAIRRLRSAGWLAGVEGDPQSIAGRSALIGSLALDDKAVSGLFGQDRHSSEALAANEIPLAPSALKEAPDPVRFDLPDWLFDRLSGLPAEALWALRERAPLDLRVNSLKTDADAAVLRLHDEGVEAEPGPLSPDCLRVIAGARKLQATESYRKGLVEIQDASSQAVAQYAGATPGDVVIDYCAGAGGKTLALATAMKGTGRLIAHDALERRMADLGPRASRAGVAVEILTSCHLHEGLSASADLVLVDAPCSGSGAWRRNPDFKWRLTEARLAAIGRSQGEILDRAAGLVRPGGRLCYATCSILAEENSLQVENFLCVHPEFELANEPLVLLPSRALGDGFFAQLLVKSV